MKDFDSETKQISSLLPKIIINLQVARLIDEIKPGLTTSQLIVLLTLKEKEVAVPVGSLTEQLSISFPAVSGIVDRLVKEKLIKRKRSNQDRRLVLIELSKEGKIVVEKMISALEKLLSDVLAKMPSNKQKTTINAIKEVFKFSIVLAKDNKKRGDK